MKLRTGTPWMPAKDYAHSLESFSVNLIVKEIEPSLRFQREVLRNSVVYSDPDFAVIRGYGAEWMLHADHTYLDHPMNALLSAGEGRGIGVELRLHGCDPDEAERAAKRLGFRVLAATADKPYGLREAQIMDPDGYIWVPDVRLMEAD